ncbi:MAG: hypothetical protein AB7Q27_20680 [Acidimicrobiia bacterium]
MHTLADQLARHARTISHRSIPPCWPQLDRDPDTRATVGELIAVIDSFTSAPIGDRLIAGLLGLPVGGRIDPRTVLLIALAPRLRANHRNLPTAGYDDALTELATLLCEPNLLDTLKGRTGLADVLARRAGARHRRRHQAVLREHTRAHLTDYTASEDHRYASTDPADDLDEHVTNRIALAEFHTRVANSIANGATSAAQWNDFVDSVLRPAVGVPRNNPGRRPSTTHLRRALATHLNDALTVAA